MRRPRERAQVRVILLQSSHAAHHPRHHHRFAAALAAAGYDVRTMAQPDLRGGHEDAVPVLYLPPRRTRLGRMLTGPLTVARALRARPDVLHVVCLDLLPWAVLARALRRELKVLYDSNEEYDLYVEIKDWLPRPLRRPLARLVRRWEPRLAKRLDAVTVAVPATEAKLRAAGARALLVRNLPPRRLARDAGRSAQPAFDVLVGGSLPAAQMPLVAETAALLAEALGRPARWLVVARHQSPRERRLLEQILRRDDVVEQFTLLHDRPFPELGRLARSAAVGFAPYPGDAHYRVALPIRLFEYMAWGVPFVTSELPDLARLLDGVPVGLFTRPGDPAAYATGLARLLSSPELARTLGANGRRLVLSRLHWEREAPGLVELYDRLAGATQPASLGRAA